MKTTLRALALSLTAALVLSGCMRVEMSLDLGEDDTASGSYLFAIEEGLGETLGATDDEAVEGLFGEMSQSIEGATEEAYNEDGFVGTRVTFEDKTFAELNLDSEELSVTRVDDDYVLEGTLAGDETAGASQMPSDAIATFTVTFPGAIEDSNGTVEGSTVTWDLTDSPESLYAKGSATADSELAWWAWALIALSALLVIAGVVVLILGSRKRNAASPSTASADVHSDSSAQTIAPASPPDVTYQPEAKAPPAQDNRPE